MNCHADDDIYQEIVKAYLHISRGTVYRNLNQLAAGNEIRKAKVTGGADRFES
ncbi:transcriptional repressor [Lachnospiraceae bacterium ZAX-1]